MHAPKSIQRLAQAIMLAALLVAAAPLNAQAAVQVASQEELEQALAQGETEIEVAQSFSLSSTVAITGQARISAGEAATISMANNTMFAVSEGGELALGGQLTLNGSGTAQFVDVAQGTLVLEDDVVLTRGYGKDGAGCINVHGEGASLSMLGGTLSACGTSSNSGAISVRDHATASIEGGTVTGTSVSHRSGSVLVRNATLEMSGGTISNGEAYSEYSSGGVFVDAHFDEYSSFTMSGGTITGCESFYGGGVHVTAGSTSTRGDYSTDPNTTKSDFFLTGGLIDGNSASKQVYSNCGGGVFVGLGGRMYMSGGTISNNTAIQGSGGGIGLFDRFTNNYYRPNSFEYEYEYDDEAVNRTGTPVSATDWPLCFPSSLVMTGGTISNNRATEYWTISRPYFGNGGGIYAASSLAELHVGRIENNTADEHGGGIYCASVPYILHIYESTITQNTARRIGGGVWLCPTGEVDAYITDGAAVYGNSAAQAGDDFVFRFNRYAVRSVIAERMLGGGSQNWHYDGTVPPQDRDGFEPYCGIGRGPRYSADSEAFVDYGNITDNVALKADPNQESINLSAARTSLWIVGNTANRGGGIGSDGHVYVGQKGEKELTVKKDFLVPENFPADELPRIAVAVWLTITSDGVPYRVGTAELNYENNWTYTFTGLPMHAQVLIEEEDVEGWIPVYRISQEESEDGEFVFQTTEVTNCRPGVLELSKKVVGNAGNPEQEFTFKVKIVDENGVPYVGHVIERDEDGAETAIYYDRLAYELGGSQEGVLEVDEEGVAYITLKHGESVTVSGIPHGARYTVEETGDTGYMIEPERSDGARGREAETGEIEGDATTSIAYTNERSVTMGSLSIEKRIAGNAADPEQEFLFRIHFHDKLGLDVTWGEFAYTGSREGTVESGETVALKPGEKIVIEGIPAGFEYEVEELGADGYEIEVERDDGAVGAEATAGAIASGHESALVFTNRKDETMGSLAISKTVEGAKSDERFSFTVRFYDAEGEEIRGAEFAYVGAHEGVVASGGAVELSHGERIQIDGLPEGTRFAVEEAEAAGFESSSEGAQGTIAAGEVAEARFTNKAKEEPAPEPEPEPEPEPKPEPQPEPEPKPEPEKPAEKPEIPKAGEPASCTTALALLGAALLALGKKKYQFDVDAG